MIMMMMLMIVMIITIINQYHQEEDSTPLMALYHGIWMMLRSSMMSFLNIRREHDTSSSYNTSSSSYNTSSASIYHTDEDETILK